MQRQEALVDQLSPRTVGRPRSVERLGELYATHAPRAFRVAYLLTGDKDASADIVQDAFVRLLGRFADLRNRDAFGAYLRRIVVSLTIDRMRKLRAERAGNERERAMAPRESGSLPDMESRDAIGRALRGLPPRQQAALVLRFYEDLTEHQIADALRCSVPAAKGLISRGLRSLEDRLGGEEWT
jgi:RNA polymerase sigma factor (sigma-70 family)